MEKITSYFIDNNYVLHTYIRELKHVTIENVRDDKQAEKIIDELNKKNNVGKYAIARFEHGICLNDYEYILDKKNEILTFSTKENAREYLTQVSNVNQSIEDWEEEGIYIKKIELT